MYKDYKKYIQSFIHISMGNYMETNYGLGKIMIHHIVSVTLYVYLCLSRDARSSLCMH